MRLDALRLRLTQTKETDGRQPKGDPILAGTVRGKVLSVRRKGARRYWVARVGGDYLSEQN